MRHRFETRGPCNGNRASVPGTVWHKVALWERPRE
jgi:hypothetical protein